jgi:hypothetical protein
LEKPFAEVVLVAFAFVCLDKDVRWAWLALRLVGGDGERRRLLAPSWHCHGFGTEGDILFSFLDVENHLSSNGGAREAEGGSPLKGAIAITGAGERHCDLLAVRIAEAD